MDTMIRESYRAIIINIMLHGYFQSNIYLQDIFSSFESIILYLHVFTS